MSLSRTLQQRLAQIGLSIPDLLVPRPDVDLSIWSVNACDQHVHDRSYWDRSRDRVGSGPSSLDLILPEADLHRDDLAVRINGIHRKMEDFLGGGILQSTESGFMVVSRETACNKRRKGILLAFDLEAWHQPEQRRFALRPTERVVEDRLPARLSIRENAALEMPHVLVLVDDSRAVISKALDGLSGREIYRTTLPENAGELRGAMVRAPDDMDVLVTCLEEVATTANPDAPVWFIGDGNHSLEAARRHWNHVRKGLIEPGTSLHPARHFLAELVPLQSPGLEVLPVHRRLAGVANHDLKKAFENAGMDVENCHAIGLRNDLQADHGRWLAGWISEELAWGVVSKGAGSEPFGSIVDEVVRRIQTDSGAAKIEYLHGWDEAASGDPADGTIFVRSPTRQNLAQAFRAGEIFPPKSFSLGGPSDKRHYFEARRLRHPD
jgi:hypothetical protein